MQKKLFKSAFIAFFAFFVIFITGQVPAEANEVEEVAHSHGVVQGSDALDVREGPGDDYDVVGQLDDDTRVELEGQNSDGWYKINADDINEDAYVSEEGLVPVDEPDEEEGYVDASTSVNVREGPGSSYDQVESLSQGESIDLLGEVEGWYKIQLDDVDSTYISGDYVTFTEPLEAAELTETARTHGVVQGSGSLDVREGPGNDYEVVGQLDDETRVELEGQTSDGWYKINADDINEDTYVSEEGFVPVDEPDEEEGYVDASTSVNVREGPGSSYDQVDSIPRGESVDIVGEIDDWYLIQWDDMDEPAYVSGSHITSTEIQEETQAETQDQALTEPEHSHGIVQSSSLNVRSGPGTDYDTIAGLEDYTRVELEGETSDGWYKISGEGLSDEAHVSGDFIVPVDVPSYDEGYVDSDLLNVREGPNTDEARVHQLERNAQVAIVGEIGDWYKLQLADVDGPTYVNADYISEEQTLMSSDRSHGIVQSSHLNVRSGPGTDYDTIAGLDDYTRVELEGETSDGWYKISGEGLSGEAYVSGDFIVPVDVPPYDEGYVDSDLLNVREGPNTDEARVHQLERNEQVAIVGEIGDWYKLQLADVDGPTYVNTDYISEEETLVSPERSHGIVQSSHLNVRSGPGTDYDTIGGLSDYTRVELEGETSDGWYKISGEGFSGEAYVSGDFIVPVDLPEEDIGYVDANVSLNVREGPGTSYDQVSSIPRGEQIDVVGEIDGWYKIQMDDVSGPTYVSASLVSNEEITAPEVKIFIDPGHGGSDSGAAGNGLLEKDVVLDISLQAAEVLEEEYLGVDVMMPRTTDEFIELEDRAAMANDWGADYFVSLHNNAFDGSASGFESFIFDGNVSSTTIEKQEEVHQYIANELDATDRGMKTANFSVLRNTTMPAILLELLFIDNAVDAEMLGSAEGRAELGRITADAIAHAWDIEER
ncbi:SH3 domain-containing protein [Salicibibacter cibarius]|uniref:SH3 domain-containing protein n=1 Tax=Salicibibacter cibarius TaxID=2743000 RepID=A0A7T6Z021_9BACI|nr:SH3 domain-containing protein [Salicibibacter cibarius]QQK74196.1 SH3 domain-containing protein [Salicibibacter cibarius]